MDELKQEDKFIVINWKRLEELSETGHQGYLSAEGFRRELGKFVTRYEQRTGKPMDQQYIVCNQDEPYAGKVWDLILNRPETSTDKRDQSAVGDDSRMNCESDNWLYGEGFDDDRDPEQRRADFFAGYKAAKSHERATVREAMKLIEAFRDFAEEVDVEMLPPSMTIMRALALEQAHHFFTAHKQEKD